MPVKTPEAVCFTGQRPKDLYGYADRESYRKLMNVLGDICGKLADAGCNTFTSGGAQGTDQVAFWAVHHLKKSHPEIVNRVAIVERQDSRWPKGTLFGQDDFRKMQDRADEVELLTYEGTGARNAGHILNLRNEAMLDASEAVIGVFPQSRSVFDAQGSGTANCLKSAMRRKMPVIIIDPVSFEVYRDDLGIDQVERVAGQDVAAKPAPAPQPAVPAARPQTVATVAEPADAAETYGFVYLEDDPYNDYGNDVEVAFSAPWLD